LNPTLAWAEAPPKQPNRISPVEVATKLPADSIKTGINATSKPAQAELDIIHVDPNRPVIPLAAMNPLDTGDMSLDEARDALKTLMDAQQKMMGQMQVLQARIEKTEKTAEANQEALEATIGEVEDTTELLTTLSKRTRLTGYVEMGWRAYRNAPRTSEYLGANGRTGNTFDMRRAVLAPRVVFNEKASWYGEIEVEDAGADEITMEESIFTYAFKPWLKAQGGLMIPPYTYTALNHAGYQRMLVDRPLVDQLIVPSTYRDLGVGVTGTVPVLKRGALSYEFDMLNGMTDTMALENLGVGSPISSQVEFNGLRDARPNERGDNSHFRDNNANKTLFGRVGFSPFPNLQMGISASNGTIDRNDRESLSIVAGDLYWRYKKFSLLGEYATNLFERSNGISSQGVSFRQYPSGMRGYYLQAAYDVTPKLTAVSAFNHINLDTGHAGNDMKRLSMGLRYNPFNSVYVKAEYQLTTPRSQFGTQERTSNALLTQLTFFFQ
jgi:hypothetical protein